MFKSKNRKNEIYNKPKNNLKILKKQLGVAH